MQITIAIFEIYVFLITNLQTNSHAKHRKPKGITMQQHTFRSFTILETCKAYLFSSLVGYTYIFFQSTWLQKFWLPLKIWLGNYITNLMLRK